MAAFQGLLKLTTPLDISTSLKILCLTKILLTNKKYPPGQKFHLINRYFRSGRVIRHTTFSPVARQLLVFGTYDIYEKFSEDSNSAL